MWLVIDVQPVNPLGSGDFRCFAHQRLPDAATLKIGMYRRIQQKCVDATIPGYVDKADQALVRVDANVGQTMLKHKLKI